MTRPISIAEKLAKIAAAGGEVRMSRSLAKGVRGMERSMTGPQDDCPHEWEEHESMGNNEYRTDVRCIHCRMPGERDHADGSVFWPAT